MSYQRKIISEYKSKGYLVLKIIKLSDFKKLFVLLNNKLYICIVLSQVQIKILKIPFNDKTATFDLRGFIFMEIWKKIEGFENYEISNLGIVKSLSRESKFGNSYIISKEIILKHWIDKKGYSYVTLRANNLSKSFLIHRLVGIHFIENTLNKPQINHIDGNKNNNNVENLEWSTAKENLKHAVDFGLNKKHGIYNYRSKLTKKDVIFIRNSNLKQKILSEKFKITQSTISRIKLFKTYKDVRE